MVIKNLLYGIIIGIGFIVPGVSGGVIATILGIYDEIINKLLNFKHNIKYLMPLFIGIFISILLFSNIILYLMNNKLIFISYVFIGLILGCIPFLLKEIKIKTKKNISILPFITTLLIGIILYFIENNSYNTVNINFFIMVIAGIFYAIGKIVPGISGSALLMLLGVYKYFLEIIANPLNISLKTFLLLIPFILSFIISSIIILKLINYLLTNHFRITYSAIIGFVLTSILFISPNYINITCIFILLLSFIISYYLSCK